VNSEISIVTTLYKSAPYIKIFYSRIVNELKKLSLSYDIVIVNDGSPDESLDLALEIQKQDPCVVVIDLSRNFGHHKAIIEGLAFAKGARIFLIDCDLEEPPEIFHAFNERFNVGDCDVVYGVQSSRKGRLFERVSGRYFYALFNYLSDTKVPKDATIARMMSKEYVSSLLLFKEESLFLGGIMSAAGYRQVPLQIQKVDKGNSTYTLKKKLEATASAITSFSDKPLRIVFYSGIIISAASFLIAISILLQKIFWGVSIPGWAALAISIWFIGGLIILFLGLVGIYVAKIFLQTKLRPATIVRKIYGKA
jgi:putative glycosyltransferase